MELTFTSSDGLYVAEFTPSNDFVLQLIMPDEDYSCTVSAKLGEVYKELNMLSSRCFGTNILQRYEGISANMTIKITSTKQPSHGYYDTQEANPDM